MVNWHTRLGCKSTWNTIEAKVPATFVLDDSPSTPRSPDNACHLHGRGAWRRVDHAIGCRTMGMLGIARVGGVVAPLASDPSEGGLSPHCSFQPGHRRDPHLVGSIWGARDLWHRVCLACWKFLGAGMAASIRLEQQLKAP